MLGRSADARSQSQSESRSTTITTTNSNNFTNSNNSRNSRSANYGAQPADLDALLGCIGSALAGEDAAEDAETPSLSFNGDGIQETSFDFDEAELSDGISDDIIEPASPPTASVTPVAPRTNSTADAPAAQTSGSRRGVTFSEMIQERTISSTGNDTADWSSIELHRSISSCIHVLDNDASMDDPFAAADAFHTNGASLAPDAKSPDTPRAVPSQISDDTQDLDNTNTPTPRQTPTPETTSQSKTGNEPYTLPFDDDSRRHPQDFDLSFDVPDRSQLDDASIPESMLDSPQRNVSLEPDQTSASKKNTPKSGPIDPFEPKHTNSAPVTTFEIKTPFRNDVFNAFPIRRNPNDTFEAIGMVHNNDLYRNSQTETFNLLERLLPGGGADVDETAHENQTPNLSVNHDSPINPEAASVAYDSNKASFVDEDPGPLELYRSVFSDRKQNNQNTTNEATTTSGKANQHNEDSGPVVEDFHQLRKEMDSLLQNAEDLGLSSFKQMLQEDFGSPGRLSDLSSNSAALSARSAISNKSMHDDDSLLGNLGLDHGQGTGIDTVNDNSKDAVNSNNTDPDAKHAEASIHEAQSTQDVSTPQLSRTLPPNVSGTSASAAAAAAAGGGGGSDLFSPGAFFAQKSGSLGSLTGKTDSFSRPAWYTPQLDESGRMIDPIEETPSDIAGQSPDTGTTPAGLRRVRPPLYGSPSNERERQALSESIGATDDGHVSHRQQESVARSDGALPPLPPKPTPQTVATDKPAPKKTTVVVSHHTENIQTPVATTAAVPDSANVASNTLLPPEIQEFLRERIRQQLEEHVERTLAASLKAALEAAKQAAVSVATVAAATAATKPHGLVHAASPDRAGSLGPLSLSHLASQSMSPDPERVPLPTHTAVDAPANLSNQPIVSKNSSIETLDDFDTEQVVQAIQEKVPLASASPPAPAPSSTSINAIHITIPPPRSRPGAFNDSPNIVVSASFPQVRYTDITKRVFVLRNASGHNIIWTIDKAGPVFMQRDLREDSPTSTSSQTSPNNPTSTSKSVTKPTRHKIPDAVFRFTHLSGQLSQHQSVEVVAMFQPLLAGIYTQSYRLRAGGFTALIKISGEAYAQVGVAKENLKTGSPGSVCSSGVAAGEMVSRPLTTGLAQTMSAKMITPRKAEATMDVTNHDGIRDVASSMNVTTPRGPHRVQTAPATAKPTAATPVHEPHWQRPRAETSRSAYRIGKTMLSNAAISTSAWPSHTARSVEIENKPAMRRTTTSATTPRTMPSPLTTTHTVPRSPRTPASRAVASPSPSVTTPAHQPDQGQLTITRHDTGRSLARDVLDFGTVVLGHVHTMHLKICNAAHRPVDVHFITTGPFSLPTQYLSIQPRSYVPIPMAFHPVRPGLFQERLIVRKESHVIRVELCGVAIAHHGGKSSGSVSGSGHRYTESRTTPHRSSSFVTRCR